MKYLVSLFVVILFSLSALAEVKCPRDNNNGNCTDGLKLASDGKTVLAQVQVPSSSVPGQTDCPACANTVGWSGDLLKTAPNSSSPNTNPSGSTVFGE